MKKNSENKKIQIFLGVVGILAITFTYQYFKNVQQQEFREIAKADKEQKEKDIEQGETKVPPTRGIASVPKASIITKFKDRTIVGSVTKNSDFPISNKVNKEWEKLAYKRLTAMIEPGVKLEIKKVKPVLFVQHDIGTYVEHVKIVLKKKNGLKSAYDAYINSQTGGVIRTWNRTKFEIRPKAFLKAQGNEFIGTPLKIQSKTSI